MPRTASIPCSEFKKGLTRFAEFERVVITPSLFPKSASILSGQTFFHGMELVSRRDLRRLLAFLESRRVPLTDRAAALLKSR